MSLSLEYLQRCSAEHGFQIAAVEKVARLGVLAGDVARHPLLGEALVLKGGTALNLCFGAPRRLSVDLDFNYIGQVEREKMQLERPRLEKTVMDLAARSGYHVQPSKDTFAGRKIYLLYRSAQGQQANIQIDLNFLFRVPFSGQAARTLWQPGDLDRPEVNVVGLEELLVGKLLALLDRCAPRDAWDIAFLPSDVAEVLASARFRALFIAFAAILDHPLRAYTRDRLQVLLTERIVSEQLLPMLMVSAAVSSQDLVERSWIKVAPLVALTDSENAYLKAVHQGALHPELLFPTDPECASILAQHPAIRWKIQNARSHIMKRNQASHSAGKENIPDGN